VKVESHISNRNIDFVGEGYDLAVRVRAIPDSGLIARHLEDAALVMIASPDYLNASAHRKPWTILRSMTAFSTNCPAAAGASPGCSMTGVQREILAEGNYSCSDDVLGGVTLAKHGAGLFQTYRFIVEKELADGSLVEVLKPYGGRSRPFTLALSAKSPYAAAIASVYRFSDGAFATLKRCQCSITAHKNRLTTADQLIKVTRQYNLSPQAETSANAKNNKWRFPRCPLSFWCSTARI
jgi:DNA-binding transcriptional LysR family regulator